MPLQYGLIQALAQAPTSGFKADLGTLFGGVQIGRDTSGQFALTRDGRLAVLRPNGTYASMMHDNVDQLVDVTPLVLAGVDPMVVRIPVRLSQLNRGNLIIVSDAPFSPLLVLKPPEANRIAALDPIHK